LRAEFLCIDKFNYLYDLQTWPLKSFETGYAAFA